MNENLKQSFNLFLFSTVSGLNTKLVFLKQ